MMRIHGEKGQGILGEYAMTFVIVLSAIAVMAVYYSRAIQGRIRDGEKYMWRELKDRTQGQYNGLFYVQYEPYYVNTTANVAQTTQSKTEILASGLGTSGIFRKRVNDSTITTAISQTAPPGEADQEYQ